MHRSVKAPIKPVISAVAIISLLIWMVSVMPSRTLAGSSFANDDSPLTAAEINAIIDPIRRFNEASNVLIRIVAKLPSSCAGNTCSREREAAVQRTRSELELLGSKHSEIARAVAEHRVFVEANVGEVGTETSRFHVELSSEPVPATSSCPLQVKILDDVLTSFLPTEGLPLTAGSKATLKAGSDIEVRVIGSRNALSLFVDAGPQSTLTGKRQIGSEGLRFAMPKSEVRLQIDQDLSNSNETGIQPRALGDVIIGMQGASASAGKCEWKFLPKLY